MNIGLSLIICIVGAALYLICSRYGPAEVAELGKHMFWVGLLAFLFGH